jgi:NAD+ diphosphatase
MIGCLAEGLSEEIRLDDKELDEARWFPLEQVRKALAAGGGADGLWVPPPMAIAHQLIRFWAAPSD